MIFFPLLLLFLYAAMLLGQVLKLNDIHLVNSFKLRKHYISKISRYIEVRATANENAEKAKKSSNLPLHLLKQWICREFFLIK